jgi:hypothetical protein
MSEPSVQIHPFVDNTDVQTMIAMQEMGENYSVLAHKLLASVQKAVKVQQITAAGLPVPLVPVHPPEEETSDD